MRPGVDSINWPASLLSWISYSSWSCHSLVNSCENCETATSLVQCTAWCGLL